MNFFNKFITKIGKKAAISHVKKIREHFESLDYDTKLSYFVVLMTEHERRRADEGNVDFAPLKDIIRSGIANSMKEGHTVDGLISYYLCTVNELLNIKRESAEKIKSQLSEENRKFFP